MEIVLYGLTVVAALLSTFIGFGLEIVQGNIRHVQNGRKSEAGAAIFPSIIFIPLFYIGTAWGLNTTTYHLGFYVVFAYFVISITYKVFSFKKQGRELEELQRDSN